MPRPVRASSTTSTSAPACAGGDLDGSFTVVQGSAGAGQISYELTLTNASKDSCFVSGIPDVQLLDGAGAPLGCQHDFSGVAKVVQVHRLHLCSETFVFSNHVELPIADPTGKIQIGRSDARPAAVRNRGLGVEHGPGPLEDAHPGGEQPLVDVLARPLREAHVGVPGDDDAHVHPALGGAEGPVVLLAAQPMPSESAPAASQEMVFMFEPPGG